LSIVTTLLENIVYNCKTIQLVIDNDMQQQMVEKYATKMGVSEQEAAQMIFDEGLRYLAPSSEMPKYSVQELRDRLAEATDDARNGRTLSSEQVYKNLEQKFPWLYE